MAATVREMRLWLAVLAPDELIAVDDGGLAIISVRNPDIYIEIGGTPEEVEDDAV